MTTRLGLHDLHQRAGARFGEADGCVVPIDYGDVRAEHAAVRAGAGVIDRSHRGAIEATGRDRADFLHGMLSNDVKSLAPGQGCAAAFLDVHGKIVALPVVHCLAERLLLETDRALVETTLATLDRFLISERVELADVSGREGILTVAGPAARATVDKALEGPVPDLPLWHHAPATVEGLAVRVVRSEGSGEDGYDLWAPVPALAPLWRRLTAAGARPVGRQAWNILRVEAGFVWAGADVDASTLLLEAPLGSTYSLTKGCYIGQEVVARITYRGHVNRKIVGLDFADERIPGRGDRVVADGREVGRVTSAVVSPATGRGLALGFVRREHAQPGAAVEVAVESGTLAARVVEMPAHRRPEPA
jgi:folate-binding protein YgfZ